MRSNTCSVTLDSSRFDHTTRTWFIWTGARWQKDETRRAFAYARDLARELAQAPECKSDRRRVGSLKFANGVEAFARADQRIAVTRERWDNDIDKLGTPNGYVDLRTGEQFDPDPDLFITRSVAVEPHDVVDCRRWMKFLDEITNGDATLKTYLQRFIGYSLTGETREQKLAFIYGPGGSGKSTFTNIIPDHGRLLHVGRDGDIHQQQVRSASRSTRAARRRALGDLL